MRRKAFHLQKTLSVVDGFLILFLTFAAMKLLMGSGLFPAEWLAGFLPGGATALNQTLWQQLLQFAVMTGLTLLFLSLRGKKPRQIGLCAFPQKSWLLKAALCGVLLFVVMLLVTALLVWIFPEWAQPQAVTEIILQAESLWDWFVVVLMVCILAPGSEELLFRGYLYHSLCDQWSVWASVLLTSLFFGCMHYDLFRLLPLTFTGICLNVVAIRSGSLWGSVIMHGVWNFMMTLMLWAF